MAKCSVVNWEELQDSTISEADVRADLLDILDHVGLAEVNDLLYHLRLGLVDGWNYDNHECRCLFGTIARSSGCLYQEVYGYGDPNSMYIVRFGPAEAFFFEIREGDTPETSEFSRYAVLWVEEWMEARQSAGPDDVDALHRDLTDKIGKPTEGNSYGDV